MKAKKIVVAVLFLGGGYYFIKKILPMFSNKSNSLTTDQKEYEVKEFIIPKSGGGSNLDGVAEEPNKTKSISSIDNDIKRSRGDLLNKNNVQSVVNREGGFNMM